MMVGMEHTIGQVYHVELVSPVTGQPINTAIVGYLQQDEFNEHSSNILTANYTSNSTFYSKIETFTTGAAVVAWELIALLSGTYPFLVMSLMGVPDWMVTMFVALYSFLLARTIIGLVRGI